ncbi:fimbrial protein [Burkholderia cepacia]|uniref:fimbrial protein n=1 Tax=Burkholderia cepacia TaxID=292 RepID=UPI00158FD379|nr:fimbrial protein [Burkholderia cepacia]
MRNTILSTILFGVMASPALADNEWPGEPCYWNDNGGVTKPQGTRTINVAGYATSEFDPSVPIGTVLDSRSVPTSGLTEYLTMYCPGMGPDNVFHGRVPETADPVHHTYPTSVAGIGVRMKHEYASSQWWPFYRPESAQSITFGYVPLRVEFVKTGPITAAGSLRGEIGGTFIRNKKWQAVSYRIAGSIEIRPKVPTCAVATKQISVKMSPTGNNFTSRDFGGVGSTTPERDFSIQLNCSGGDAGTSTNAYVTLTDNSNSGNRSNRLSLTRDSKASGVAVQILKNGTPLSFGPDSSAPSTPNQWKAGNIQQGQSVFTIPLTARYIQTGTLKGGTANAVATFTMSYQ